MDCILCHIFVDIKGKERVDVEDEYDKWTFKMMKCEIWNNEVEEWYRKMEVDLSHNDHIARYESLFL